MPSGFTGCWNPMKNALQSTTSPLNWHVIVKLMKSGSNWRTPPTFSVVNSSVCYLSMV